MTREELELEIKYIEGRITEVEAGIAHSEERIESHKKHVKNMCGLLMMHQKELIEMKETLNND